jgi:hypothetical protein
MNNKKEVFDISVFNSHLNFAFCPSSALKLPESSPLFNDIANELYSEFPNQNKNDLMLAVRYFYVCYSLKIEDLQFGNQDYFYFQVFSKLAGYLKPHEAIYGFFDKEKISSMIQEINETFNPAGHEKMILDSFAEDICLDAGTAISELQKWTELKLVNFNKFYFLDSEVLLYLSKIIDNEKKFSDFQKNKKRTNKKNPVSDDEKKQNRKKNKRGAAS